MKLKTRSIILAVIAIFLFVTFKILGPELQKYDKKWYNVGNSVRSDRQGRQKNSNNKGDNQQKDGDKRENLIHQMIQKYRVNYFYPLKTSPWVIASEWISSREIHPEESPELGAILKLMATGTIMSADVGYRGTQLKLSLTLEGGQRVSFKPKWYDRDYIIQGPPYAGADRHNGEITAFHLNRLLEFRRAPMVVGRRINLETEIMPVGTHRLLETFFTKDNNTCFYGKCYYCRGKEDGVCAQKTVLEGAVVLWVPKQWELQLYRHPWGRTYRQGKLAKWETYGNYCSDVQKMERYKTGPLLLDIIDTCVFDYLIGNADRHHYETFKDRKNAVLLLLDNAKSFGDPYTDEETILAPLYQCCKIRTKTWKRLLALQEGVISEVLRGIMEREPIAPVLDEPHFEAMDRRLTRILTEIEKCFQKFGTKKVLFGHKKAS